MTVQPRPTSETAYDNVGAMNFVRSKMFSNIFTEGMQLVEETASYLDGEGRDAARDLDRADALAYAGLSMRLTTRLMQIASWLLVMRAVREEEMGYEEAAQDKYRLGTPEPHKAARKSADTDNPDNLPPRLMQLRTDTARLHERIVRIDSELFELAGAVPAQDDAASRIAALNRAFGND